MGSSMQCLIYVSGGSPVAMVLIRTIFVRPSHRAITHAMMFSASWSFPFF